MFDKLKQLMELKSKMEVLKRELDATVVEAHSDDKTVSVKMSAALEVKSVAVSAALPEQSRAALEKAVSQAVTEAITQARKSAAEKMGSITGLNLPGGLG